MEHLEFAPRPSGRRGPLTLKPHRRPVHRPDFDLLECRVLPAVPVVQYPLPDGPVYPASLVPGADGSLWLVRVGGDEIDRIAPDGTVTKIPLGIPTNPEVYIPPESVFNSLTIGPDGNIWVDGMRKIDRVTPDGVVTSFDLGRPRDWPVGGFPSAIAAGPDGALWFVDVIGSIGRITTDGTITEYPLPSSYGLATSITSGPDGALWFTSGEEIGRITTDGTIEEFTSAIGTNVDDITLGPDGNLWFLTWPGRQIGRITPDGHQDYFTPPTASAYPTSLKVGPDGALWFDEAEAGQLGRITDDGTITEYPLPDKPTEDNPWRGFPIEIAFGADGSLFYTTHLIGAPTTGTDPATGVEFHSIYESHAIDRVDASDFVAIVAQPVPISLSAEPGFDGALASFQPIDPGEPSGDYSATIDWGDGSTSPGVVVPGEAGSFQVDSSHAFDGPGTFAVSVTVTAHRSSPLPFVLPAVVRDTVTVVSGPEPIPGPGPASDDHSAPPALPLSDPPQDSPTLPPSAPPSPAPPPDLPSTLGRDQPEVMVTAGAPASPPASTGLLPLVPLDPPTTSNSIASPSATPGVLATSAAESSTASRPATRAVKPVPTVGLASPRLTGPRRAPKPAPRPARASVPEVTVGLIPWSSDRLAIGSFDRPGHVESAEATSPPAVVPGP